MKTVKTLQESAFTPQSRRVNIFTAVKYSMRIAQWHHFSDVTNCVTFYEHGAVNGRRQVFDKMFENGKRLECFPNDV